MEPRLYKRTQAIGVMNLRQLNEFLNTCDGQRAVTKKRGN